MMKQSVVGLLLCALILCLAIPGQTSPPFPDTEYLTYRVEWDPPWYLFFLPAMEAGEVEVRMTREAEYQGRKTVKISLMARSSGILHRLSGVKIDDAFVFLSEPETFCTLSVTKKVREGKRKRQIHVDYLPETRQLHIRELDEAYNPPRLRKDEKRENIPPCVMDPLSALYSFRQSPLNVEYEKIMYIGNDDKIKEVRSRVELEESVNTPAGKFRAWRVDTVALMGGLFREGGEFKIWLSADGRKIPLQFEAKVQLGRVLGKLTAFRH